MRAALAVTTSASTRRAGVSSSASGAKPSEPAGLGMTEVPVPRPLPAARASAGPISLCGQPFPVLSSWLRRRATVAPASRLAAHDDIASLHHKHGRREASQVSGGISRDADEVGSFSGLYGAGLRF